MQSCESLSSQTAEIILINVNHDACIESIAIISSSCCHLSGFGLQRYLEVSNLDGSESSSNLDPEGLIQEELTTCHKFNVRLLNSRLFLTRNCNSSCDFGSSGFSYTSQASLASIINLDGSVMNGTSNEQRFFTRTTHSAIPLSPLSFLHWPLMHSLALNLFSTFRVELRRKKFPLELTLAGPDSQT